MSRPRTVVLDNEAVQALADPAHRKHRRVLAVVEAVAARHLRRSGSVRLVVPTSVRVEAGWDFVGDAYNPSAGQSVPKPDPDPLDCTTIGGDFISGGHGTHAKLAGKLHFTRERGGRKHVIGREAGKIAGAGHTRDQLFVGLAGASHHRAVVADHSAVAATADNFTCPKRN